ncbi:GCN5 family acetyltransferase [Novimethylophilus kurashikiensis]|uniref:GCN5 family acetyltransferase n=1 Tax=Novimethylophilus kurashikiensis TaxID=1825523 RepID=A0A2R5FAC9_9PROT|nr:GNAT family N-acetyltransferase [Novimethylophilus kurashikiensis]GBG13873.1 GCN5 family acetyltransferase [Novimethylophilus kurashikiensis]
MSCHTITDAIVDDIPALLPLLDSLFNIEQDFQPDRDKQARGLGRLIEASDRAVIKVAKTQEGRLIGMVSAQLVISTAEGAYSVWIEDMVIVEEYRAQGIGRQLLQAALDWAYDKGATRAQLLVDLDNTPAIGYYDHLGWESTRLGARRLYLK